MITDLPLIGLKLVEIKLFQDDRGFFTEWYQEDRFTKAGITSKFIQDNYSLSKPGVVRGLHYQSQPSQGKLVGVLRGKIFDVVVDLRSQSSTYGQWYGLELSDTNGKLLYIPPGFAHGFSVMGSEEASVMYKVDAPYSPSSESGIRYNDPTLKIEWPKHSEFTVSAKDQVLPGFGEYSQNPIF